MNSSGRVLRVSVFGESHGPAIGCVIDGCPPGIALNTDDFSGDLGRRRSGSPGTTPRKETDEVEILGGAHSGHTTGSPLVLMVRNQDTRSADYAAFVARPRPGHADFTARVKYGGFTDPRGGGHFSGRVTAGLVLAGVVAKKILSGVSLGARIIEIGGVPWVGEGETAAFRIKKAMDESDSVGGIVECVVSGLPAGLGEPFFDSVESVLAHSLFAIPAIRGVEFGDGFRAARMSGSEHNDAIADAAGHTATNHCGGINGGITNGNDLVLRIAVKPTSSIARPQATFDFTTGKPEILVAEGRHDACIALRMPVIVESVCALALADLTLIRKAYGKEKS